MRDIADEDKKQDMEIWKQGLYESLGKFTYI